MKKIAFLLFLLLSTKVHSQEDFSYVINDILDRIYEQNVGNSEEDSVYVLCNLSIYKNDYFGKLPIKIGLPSSSDSLKTYSVVKIQEANKKKHLLQIKVSNYCLCFEKGTPKMLLGGGWIFYYSRRMRKYEYRKVEIWGI